LADLADEFDDDEFSSLLENAVEEFYDLLSGSSGTFVEVLDWLENYEEYKDSEDDE
jgi:hypothetical protein